MLAIAAAKLGWDPVAGCDHEPAAVEAAAANAAANGVEVAVERINLREQAPPPAATVTANLTAPLLIPLAERIAAGAIAAPEPDGPERAAERPSVTGSPPPTRHAGLERRASRSRAATGRRSCSAR